MRWATWAGETVAAEAIAGRFPPAATADDAPGGDTDDAEGDSEGDKPPPAWQSMPPGGDKAAAVLRDNPTLTNAEVAKLAECDPRTVTRARKTIDRSPA
jgi:hypothetical protein